MSYPWLFGQNQERKRISEREIEDINQITKVLEIERVNKNKKKVDNELSYHIKEYRRGECIGSGKIGSVYSGLSMNTGEIVAMKTIKINEMSRMINVVKVVEELKKLQHKNILKYIGSQLGQDENEIDIITDVCNGGSVKQLLEKFDFFDEKLIKLYVKQILEGLIYLHGKGIVHRNINTSNILIDGNGVVKLSDLYVSNVLIGDDPKAIMYFNTNNGQGKNYII